MDLFVRLKNSSQVLLTAEGASFFLPKSWRIVTYHIGSVSVWGLPQHAGGDCVLLLHWADSSEEEDLEKLNFQIFYSSDHIARLQACDHENRFASDFSSALVDVSSPYSVGNLGFFLDGIESLLCTFLGAKEVEDKVQWSLITKYLRAHVNSSFGDDSKSVMSIFCSLVCSDSEHISWYRKLIDLLLMS